MALAVFPHTCATKINFLGSEAVDILSGMSFSAVQRVLGRITLIAMAATIWLTATPAFAGFNAPLVQCSLVTVPSTVINCGSDPLTRGVVSIDDQGDLDLVLVGAGANETYQVNYFSIDGNQAFNITNNLTTDAKGNREFQKKVEFALGKEGAGTIILKRGGANQYLTGIHVAASHGPAGPDYRARFARCGDIDTPGPAATCGSDPIKNGSVSIDSQDGDLNLSVTGASANTSYALVLRAIDGSEMSFGTVGTNSKGIGSLHASSALSPPGTTASGVFVLTRSGEDQALGGFDVTEKPKPKPASSAGLVRCFDVNFPAALDNCGTDALASGSATINSMGKLVVNLKGAAPSTTYEVFFRPLNSDSSGDQDTTLAITTDDNGNGKGTITFASSGKIGAGNFVLEAGGFDQFVTGFAVK